MRTMRILSLKGFGSENRLADVMKSSFVCVCVRSITASLFIWLIQTLKPTHVSVELTMHLFYVGNPEKKTKFWGPDYSEINAAAADLHLLCYFCLPEYFKQ